MPECRNCGGFVTENYVQVFASSEVEGVRVCPNCEDKLHNGHETAVS